MIMADSSAFRHYGIALELAAFQSPCAMAAVSRTAGLSIGYTRRSGSRSFYVRHVAGVLMIGNRKLWSYDAKQITTAREVGLDGSITESISGVATGENFKTVCH